MRGSTKSKRRCDIYLNLLSYIIKCIVLAWRNNPRTGVKCVCYRPEEAEVRPDVGFYCSPDGVKMCGGCTCTKDGKLVRKQGLYVRKEEISFGPSMYEQ